jgi:hypothetical protein
MQVRRDFQKIPCSFPCSQGIGVPRLALRFALLPVALGIALLIASPGSPSLAGDIIADWNTAAAPPPPELKEVTVDPATTALLFLDIMKGNCASRPRCVAAVPAMIKLHDAARAKNLVLWYSLVGSNGKATPDDIMDPAIKPHTGEWYRQGGPDKLWGRRWNRC